MIVVPPLRSERTSRHWRPLGTLLLAVPLLGGCAVIAVADVAASAVVGAAGLAVDAAVGTARIGGKIIGAGADAVLDDEEASED